MSKTDFDEGPVDPSVKPEEDLDALSVYLRDVEARERMSHDQERQVAQEIAACRDDIVSTIRQLILAGADEMGLDATSLQRLREELADPVSENRLAALESRIEEVATLAKRAGETLRRGERSWPADSVAAARRLLTEITRGFGVSPAKLERVAADLAEKKRRIAVAKQRLVEANLRLVLYFARKMKWRGVDIIDLVQEGNLALLRAAETFDPKRGSGFASFACTAIRRAMSRFGSAASQPVHVPTEVRARRTRVRKAENYLTGRDGTPPTWQTIADYLGLTLADVIDALGEREEALSLDGSGDDAAPVLHRLADDSALDAAEALAIAQTNRQVRSTVANLDERDRTVIESRFNLLKDGGATLAEVGRDLGVTRERARQLEGRALRQLRTRSSAARRRKRPGKRPPAGGAVRAS
jgi:RNA polymerase primary sigma factor